MLGKIQILRMIQSHPLFFHKYHTISPVFHLSVDDLLCPYYVCSISFHNFFEFDASIPFIISSVRSKLTAIIKYAQINHISVSSFSSDSLQLAHSQVVFCVSCYVVYVPHNLSQHSFLCWELLQFLCVIPYLINPSLL